jgi:tRNA(His) guanylyltransferase
MYSTARDSPPRRTSENYKRGGQVWSDLGHDEELGHPGIAELPNPPTRRTKSHSRLHSAPVSASVHQPSQSSDPLQNPPRSNAKPQHHHSQAAQTAQGRPVQQSRTQKDRERKKRSKARILIEHVDIIRDEFWERRPWILSGRTG